MIKFFRKIRHKLVAEKKFSNYILYAIGEIVLVVIGILIALTINNANQKRITREKEQAYLVGLKNEFETSRVKLQELIRVNRQNYEGAKKIVGYISEEANKPDEKEFSQLLFNTFAFDVAFNPNNSLLTEMINSGSLRDISSTELRRQLTNWVSSTEDIAKQEDDLEMQREKVLDMFRSNQQSLRTILDLTGLSSQEIGIAKKEKHKSNLKLLHSTEFENNLLMFILASQATEASHYDPLMEDLNAILKLIGDEIKEQPARS